MIEIVSYAPRIELFAREKVQGWDVWGNEVGVNMDLERRLRPVTHPEVTEWRTP